MSHKRGSSQAFDWHVVFSWFILFRALRLAVSARSLLLALIALVATAAGWRVLGATFDRQTVAWPWQNAAVTAVEFPIVPGTSDNPYFRTEAGRAILEAARQASLNPP